MKKLIFGILIATLAFSCNQSPQENSQNTKSAKPLSCSDYGRIFEPTDTGFASTDYVFDFNIELPEGFFFDTITINDSVYRARYNLYFLQCSLPGMEKFNKAIRQEILSNVDKDKQYLDPCKGDEPIDPIYTYELGPFELFKNNKILSLCCIIDTYTEGGNHHNYSWYTFNYNLKENKVIQFSDLFVLQSKKDSVEFIRLISLNQNEETNYMDIESSFDSVDFSFVKKGLCFNPELSWAVSMQRCFVLPDSLKRFTGNCSYL